MQNSVLQPVKSKQYTPFGSVYKDRAFEGFKDYRNGFDSQEKDDEISGKGNNTTATFWEYDTRLGRRWNIDPVEKIGLSSYLCFGGNPITHTDINGDDDVFDRKGNFLFSTKTGSLIKIITPQGIQALSQFTADKNHSLATAKIVDYYKIDAGFKKNDKVGVSSNYHDKAIAYTNNSGSWLNTTKGGSDPLVDDSKNLISVFKHENIHKTLGQVSTFQDHLDVYSAQMDDASTFKETTQAFKTGMANSYGSYLLGGYDKGEFLQTDVSQKIDAFNKKYQKYDISIIDETAPASQVGMTLTAHGKTKDGKEIVSPITASPDPH